MTLTADKLRENAFDCVLDSARGRYIGQGIAERFGKYLVEEVKDILLAGPEHEHYDDAWTEALDNTEITENGIRYKLDTGENGDVFLVNLSMIESWELETGLDFWGSLS